MEGDLSRTLGGELRIASVCRPIAAPARSEELELFDSPDEVAHALPGGLADLRRVNRWLGGAWLTLRGLEALTRDVPPGRELRILDVGTGGGDLPERMARWARRRALRPRVVGLDSSPEILALARASADVELELGDARSLPFPDGSFDVVTCSLLLHHLPPDDAVLALREMRRVARLGVIVNDLVRTWFGLAGAWILSRAFTRNPLTRHDAPLSVRRAYTVRELHQLAERAGLGRVRFERALGYRVAMIAGEPA